eukprot:scaffold38558_cov55-Cyclotella_meneghiniana.AAC.9
MGRVIFPFPPDTRPQFLGLQGLYGQAEDEDEIRTRKRRGIMRSFADVGKAEIAEDVGVGGGEAALDFQEVLRWLMDEAAEINAAIDEEKLLVEVVGETNSNISSDAETVNAVTTTQTNTLSLLDKDDYKQVDKFQPSNNMMMDNGTTTQSKERLSLGRDMSYVLY